MGMFRRLLLILLICGTAQATTILSINWSDLPTGSYYVDFQMASGDGIFGNNSATIKAINPQRVTLYSPIQLNGWATEVQPLELLLTDNDPSLAPVPDFFNGGLLSFSVDSSGPGGFALQLTTTNEHSGLGLSDSLTIAILDSSFTSTYQIDSIGVPNIIAGFDGIGALEFTLNPGNIFPYDTIVAPQLIDTNIPEPATWLAVAGALAFLAARKNKRLLALILSTAVLPTFAQQAWLVKDTTTTINNTFASQTQTLTQLGSDIVFVGFDMTQSGQNPGLFRFNSVTRTATRFFNLTVAYEGLATASKGIVIQEAYDLGYGNLWISDGTAVGTKLIASSRNCYMQTGITLPNGIFMVNCDTIIGGIEVWRSDGTAAGTFRVLDGQRMEQVAIFNNRAYFTSYQALWSSDGTIQGTSRTLQDVTALDSISTGGLAAFRGRLYFQGCQAATGCELWSTDGTAAGTSLVFESIPGTSYIPAIRLLGATANYLFLSILDPLVGYQLWRSDGTQAGTILLKDIAPNTTFLAFVSNLALDQTFFTLTSKNRLWRSDGTVAGTYEIASDVNSKLYKLSATNIAFLATTLAEGTELWKSDGTLGGTVIVKELAPNNGSYLTMLNVVSGKVYMNLFQPVVRNSIWESDGTAAGTRLAVSLTEADFGARPQPAVSLNGYRYYLSSSPQGCDLNRTDGTVAGTTLVASIPGECFYPSNQPLTVFNNQLFFTLQAGNNAQVWRSDGTPQSTVLVRDFPNSSIRFTATSGDRLYVRINGFNQVVTLYASDGSTFTPLINTVPEPYILLYSWAPIGQRSLVFSASQTAGEIELYITDGTPQGTGLLANLDPNASSEPVTFANINGLVYFSATVGGTKRLFRTDGTAQGTVLLANLPAGSFGPFPSDGDTARLWFSVASSSTWAYQVDNGQLVNIGPYRLDRPLFTRNGFTYFLSTNSGISDTVVRTNGTSLGTAPIAMGETGVRFSIINSFWANNALYLSAGFDYHYELWRTDGTSPLRRVWQVNPRTASRSAFDQFGDQVNRGSFPSFVAELPNNRMLMSANDGVRGYELWAYEDTPCIPATDRTSQLTLTTSAPTINRLTGRAVQSIRIVNNGPALDNVAYIASGLNAQHDIFNRHGLTQCFTPAGPYRDIGSIAAGQTVNIVIEFVVKPGVPFSYTPRVIAREGAR